VEVAGLFPLYYSSCKKAETKKALYLRLYNPARQEVLPKIFVNPIRGKNLKAIDIDCLAMGYKPSPSGENFSKAHNHG
jgi:hypothetical protein